MLSNYDHVRGFDLSNRHVTQGCVQPPKILSLPPNRQPQGRIVTWDLPGNKTADNFFVPGSA